MSLLLRDHRMRAEGREEGRAEGRAEGCKALVDSLREFNVTDKEIIKKLMEKFEISEEEATLYI